MSNTPTLLASVTILTGQSLSEAISFDSIAESTIQTSNYRYPSGLRLFGLVMPSVWTAANITFQTSFDLGVTWVDIADDSGNEIMIVAASSKAITLRDPTIFSSIPRIKIRSGTSAAPVNQTTDRTITLILRGI